MSPQVRHLAELVVKAKAGDDSAVQMLRHYNADIAASEKMPGYDVIVLAEFFVAMGERASETQARTN